MRGRTSGFRLLASIVTSILLLGTGTAAAQAAAGPQAESQFLDLINTVRTDSGHPPVAMAVDLQDYARSHALRMARDNHLQHSANLGASVCCWQRIAENVGLGAYDERRSDGVQHAVHNVHRAFLDSSGHRANMVDPGHLDVGVGVVADSETGRLWVAQVFRTPRPSGTSTGDGVPSDGGDAGAEEGAAEAGARGASGSFPADSTAGEPRAASGSASRSAAANPGRPARDASTDRRAAPAASNATGQSGRITPARVGPARASDARPLGNVHPFALADAPGPRAFPGFLLLGLHRHAHPADFGLDEAGGNEAGHDRGEVLAVAHVTGHAAGSPATVVLTIAGLLALLGVPTPLRRWAHAPRSDGRKDG